MAVNEKVAYAKGWTTHAGQMLRPGEQMTGRVPDEVIRNAEARGLTTGSHAEAERAKSAEAERRARVAHEIETRSEKREVDKQLGQRVVQMPDGSFRLAD